MARISKRLSPKDVEESLAFPLPRILSVEEGEIFQLQVRDKSDQAWTFSCSIQQHQEMGLALTVGWLEFVGAKGIKADDEVILQGEFMGSQDMKLEFLIEVKRKIKLFGKDMWGNLV
ncbi:hypothetical protein CCACVL1_00371 [Corchorus capsularis]|uniref:TF-B3 domain-containing protein n=1 Tax=Corchorus capsularis TaxID=210143 RepID=A0A1R3KX71_COCAP|nr:hypothetical protein CCACVL1_00371 [Corchorus capsularis]